MSKSASVLEVAALPGHPVWCGAPILGFVEALKSAEHKAVPIMAARSDAIFDALPVREALGLHPGHALGRSVPDWGITLTEPQATKGVAHLVQGRPARIRGLLDGLGISATDKEIETAEVQAETSDRIDLLISLGARRIIVEAKFGHVVTVEQLSHYINAVRGREQLEDDRDVLLLIDPETAPDLHDKQCGEWRVCSWAGLLLAFERVLAKAPSESDDDDFRLFRRLLWERIGGLGMRRYP